MSLAKPILGRPERPSMPLVLFGKVYVATPDSDGDGYVLRAVERRVGYDIDPDADGPERITADGIRTIIASPV